MKAWHFASTDRMLQFPHNGKNGVKIRKGVTLHVDPRKLCMCSYGLHASPRVLDALNYAPWNTTLIVSRVELSGKMLHTREKVCAQYRKVLWWADCTAVLHEFACWCAEQALKLVDNPDPRSLAAIQAKRDWMAGKITDGELAAAGDAARAAGNVARAAAWGAHNRKLTRMINQLHKTKS